MKKGFTLLELLVSTIILSVGIMGIGALFPAALRSSLLTRQNSQAIEYCQQEIEFLRTLNYEDTALEAGTHGPDSLDDKFERNYEIFPDYPAVDMKKIVVTVSWKQRGGGGGLDHEQSITTYISKN
ncbi:MAG: prepilin-type N-terminal cleavage/methylation domain-containing protein [bacterium]|nr:prepilin-type N-terminal cleavage/methylation domain-containing protein [bacterium]